MFDILKKLLSEEDTLNNENAKKNGKTIGELQNTSISAWGDDGSVITGLKFYATLNFNTPLRVLRRHGEVHASKTQEPPQIARDASEGIWLPITKTLEELGVDLPDMPEGTMASSFGQIPTDGGNYLPFLIAIREIVEKKASISERITDLEKLAHTPQWRDFDGWNYGGTRLGYQWIVDHFFPHFFPQKIRELGFDTPNRLAAASDEILLKVKGIGPIALKKLRNMCEEITENRDSDRYENVKR